MQHNGYYGIFPGNLTCKTRDEIGTIEKEYDYDSDEDFELKSNDEIKMQLNMTDKTLIYFINGQRHKQWYENIQSGESIAYNMAIGFRGISNYEISLTDFEVK